MPKFVQLPSGPIINLTDIQYVGKPNVIKSEGKKKAEGYTLNVAFMSSTEAVTFFYNGSDDTDVRKDYDCLLENLINL